MMSLFLLYAEAAGPGCFDASLADRSTRRPLAHNMKAYCEDLDVITTLLVGDKQSVSSMPLSAITTDLLSACGAPNRHEYGLTGGDGACEFKGVPCCRCVAVVGVDADEPAAVEVYGFVFGDEVGSDEGFDAGSGNGGVVFAPCGDAAVAVDLAERHTAVRPPGQQFGGGVRPQRPGVRGRCSVQHRAGAEQRIGACFRKDVDPAGGLGGGGWTAENGGPEFCRDAGVGYEERFRGGCFDRGGDSGGTVAPPAIEDADVLAAQCSGQTKTGGWR